MCSAFFVFRETFDGLNRSTPNRLSADGASGGAVEGRISHGVLVVEDEWLVRMELVDAFEEEGFAVVESPSAEQAIERLRGDPSLALLVTDIRLAGAKDGWDLAREARMTIPDIAVIYLSANPPAADKIVEGAVFIDKPALMHRVTAVAQALLGAHP